MIDFFHRCYNSIYEIKPSFLLMLKIPALCRYAILQFANLILPFSFRFSRAAVLPEYSAAPVVSLTSFPQRIGKVHLVIESLLRQSLRPSRIVLWLSEEQFSSVDELPKRLLKLKKYGLEIYLTPGDLRSYKKYYFLLNENPCSDFVIVDDDVFYPSYLLKSLVDTAAKYPGAVCANRCARIIKNKAYKAWPGVRGESAGPRLDLLPTGCGGVLYPANSLHKDSLNEALFSSLCKDADDIWLSCMAYLVQTPTVYTGKNEYLLSVNSFANVHLHTSNVGGSNNDNCIARVREHYISELGLDVFER